MLLCAELFSEHLKSKNLIFDTVDQGERTVIKIPSGGKTATCVFSGEDGRYMSIYLFFEPIPQDRVDRAVMSCNELNAKYKWVKFYVEQNNDLFLQEDAYLSISAAEKEAFTHLVRLFDILGEAKPVIMKAIYA